MNSIYVMVLASAINSGIKKNRKRTLLFTAMSPKWVYEWQGILDIRRAR